MKKVNARRKARCFILMMLAFCTAQVFAVCGDVNSNGSVDIVDALVVAQYYVGLNPANFDSTAADVNADGSITIVDALRIAQYYVGLVSELSCSTNATPAPTAVPGGGSISIACGSSSAVGSFQPDQYYSGGSTYNNTNTIDVSLITDNPPPAALFNNERYGAMSYTIPGFTTGGTYAVTLYFAETYLTSSGGRVFNVSINGTAVLTNFDIYAAAGAQNRAVAQAFTATADSSGQIVIQFTSVTENPKINGISVQSGTAPTQGPTGEPTPVVTTGPTAAPGGANTMGYCGCSMAQNVADGYRTVGGQRMWGGYGTGGMVVQNWTNTNSSSWQLFDQQVAKYGQPAAIWVQVCIFSQGATYDEVKQMIAAARNHCAPGATIYITGQPLYPEGNVCSLAGGADGPPSTDRLAQQAGNDASQNVIYSGTFTLRNSEVSDGCHANAAGETALGNQAVQKWGN